MSKVKLKAYTMGVDGETPSELLKYAFSQCYQKPASLDVVLRNLRHESVLEHISFMFEVRCSRSCLAQLTRHRVASYTVQSHRYTEPDFEMSHIPSRLKGNKEAMLIIIEALEATETAYYRLLELGFNKEIARTVTTQCIPVNLTMTFNIRSLLNFLRLRTDPHAEEEIRELAHKMAGEIEPAFRDCKELYFKIIELGVFRDDK